MLTRTPAWQALATHADTLRSTHLRELFAVDRARFDHFSLRHGKLLLDFSKQRITGETLRLLRELAAAADLPSWIHRMQAGEAINHTEQRAARHMDLRAGNAAPPEVETVLRRMSEFCDAVHSGQWRGFSNEYITDIVNLGIGGSDLGPRMVVEALSARQQPDITVHFVSNLDGADLASTLTKLNPRTTLFIIASKTFGTLETLTNARTARDWLLAAAGQTSGAVAKHFVAASTNLAATRDFGIDDENVFEFWDWVGGRFSLWSAIGLPIALAIGERNFRELLAGARDMDQHFTSAPAEKNLPLTLALLSLWNTDFLHAASHGIFPYSQSLSLLPRYLQQLEMESNGKVYDRNGQPINVPTSPIIWGEAGTNGQHSFFQLLHQGSQPIPSDFIALGKSDYPLHGHHTALLANCLAQSAALAFGQTREEARASGIPEPLLPYRTFPGNQPSTTLVLGELSPYTLGQLIALYEHKVFCLSVLWNLNAFDQWGVELGKQMAARLIPVVRGEADDKTLDSSTAGLITHLRQFRMS
jgi:glucose-6-phosphate isomerase